MRTNVCTPVTLDTVLRFPYRDVYRDTTSLVCGRSGRSGTIYIILESRYRKCISFLCVYLRLDILNEIYNVCSAALNFRCEQAFVLAGLPGFRNFYFVYLFCSGVNGVVVHLYDLVALSSVGSLRSLLHQVDGFLLRNDGGQLEECGLQYGVDTSAKSDLLTDLDTVDGVELDVVVGDVSFYLSRQVLLKTFHIPWAVEKECTAVYQLLNHVVLVHIRRIVAGHKVRLMDQVGGLDRGFTKS